MELQLSDEGVLGGEPDTPESCFSKTLFGVRMLSWAGVFEIEGLYD